MQEQQKVLWKVDSLERVARENERFLGYVLPLRMQEAIYKTVKPITKGREQLLSLMEYHTELVQEMITDLNEADKNTEELRKERQEKEKARAKGVKITQDWK